MRAILAILMLFFPDQSVVPSQEADLSPAAWPDGELEKYTALNAGYGLQKPLAEGRRAMIAGVTQALALRAGFEALRQGGSAADAVMTAALSDATLAAGSSVSFAGEMVMAYYEASGKQVHSMVATYNTVLDEESPSTIPPQGVPSGRATLVPGFMAGVQAAHDRFGKVPFAKLFEPAIYFARKGFKIDGVLGRRMAGRKEVITRYPEGRELFLKPDGTLHREGDRFRQPRLAETLEKTAEQGAAYMYEGDWARKFVEAVRREGGKMTLHDLKEYRVVWPEPARTTYRGYVIFGSGLPSYGGVNTIEALNLLELADLPGLGYYTRSAEALYRLIRICQVADLLSPPLIGSFVPLELFRKRLPDLDLSPESRMTKEGAKRLWEAMRDEGWLALQKEAAAARAKDSEAIETISEGFGRKRDKHTSGVVAVDEAGNMAVLIHSINSSIWGDTGLFVGGVSIPDSGAFQQALIEAVGPGAKVPEWDNPTIVLKDGKPYLGCTSVGVAYHEANIQCLVNVLDYGVDPRTATLLPPIRKKWPCSAPLRHPLGRGEFSEQILQAVKTKGLDLEIVKDASKASFQGYWVGIRIDPESGRIEGGTPQKTNGYALGF